MAKKMKPSDSIQNYPDVGDCIQFEHPYPGNCEVWDDLEEFIESNLPDFYRLEESSYEFDGDISQVPAILKAAGFKEPEKLMPPPKFKNWLEFILARADYASLHKQSLMSEEDGIERWGRPVSVQEFRDAAKAEIKALLDELERLRTLIKD